MSAQARRSRRSLGWGTLIVLVLAVLLLHTTPVYAAFSLFDSLVSQTGTQASGWIPRLIQFMQPVFKTLAVIELAAAAAIWMFEKDSLNGLALEVIKKIMVIGFFSFVLQNASLISSSISSMFQQAGATAAGIDTSTAGQASAGGVTLSTDGIINIGLNQVGSIWKDSSALIAAMEVNPEEILGTANPTAYAGLVIGGVIAVVSVVATVIILIAYVIVAAQFFTLTIESYVMFAVGVVILGLGSTTWTKDYALKYLNYAINVGVRYLTLILLLSITLNAVSNMSGGGFNLGSVAGWDFDSLWQVIVGAILQAILALKAPDMANALLNGGSGLTAGSFKGAAATVGAAAMAPVAKAASALQGASNLTNAVRAGQQLSQATGGSGSMVSGLGHALGGAAKAVPGLLKNAVKSAAQSGGPNAQGGGGHKPGMFEQARQGLETRLQDIRKSAEEATQKNNPDNNSGSAPNTNTGAARNTNAGAANDAGAAGNPRTGAQANGGGPGDAGTGAATNTRSLSDADTGASSSSGSAGNTNAGAAATAGPAGNASADAAPNSGPAANTSADVAATSGSTGNTSADPAGTTGSTSAGATTDTGTARPGGADGAASSANTGAASSAASGAAASGGSPRRHSSAGVGTSGADTPSQPALRRRASAPAGPRSDSSREG